MLIKTCIHKELLIPSKITFSLHMALRDRDSSSQLSMPLSEGSRGGDEMPPGFQPHHSFVVGLGQNVRHVSVWDLEGVLEHVGQGEAAVLGV